MVDKALLTSNSDEWSTPQDLFDQLNKEFNFTLDCAATKENSKCKFFLGEALNEPWAIPHEERIKGAKQWVGFLNPPYSKIKEFMHKAHKEAMKGMPIVCLVPARVDTQWWVKYALMAKEIRFIVGRLKFGGSENSAPFPSALVIFDGRELHRLPNPYGYGNVEADQFGVFEFSRK